MFKKKQKHIQLKIQNVLDRYKMKRKNNNQVFLKILMTVTNVTLH